MSTDDGVRSPGPGAQLFARYAYPPNSLGYCGPAEAVTLAEAGRGGVYSDLHGVAKQFSGAWPYLETLAELTGTADPMEHGLVESYWLGGGIGAQLRGSDFGAALFARIAPQAGHYWSHLTPALLEEAAANHSFHVFGVYPWSRLLHSDAWTHPLHVLDNCRIRWGTVLRRQEDEIEVENRRLVWSGGRLALSEPQIENVPVAVDGLSFLPDVRPGDRVSLHWQWLCDRLTVEQVADLESSTIRQIEVTNRRLATGQGSRSAVAGSA